MDGLAEGVATKKQLDKKELRGEKREGAKRKKEKRRNSIGLALYYVFNPSCFVCQLFLTLREKLLSPFLFFSLSSFSLFSS